MSPLEIAAVTFSVVYVILAGLEKPLCWPAGIIASALYIVYGFETKYYQDAILQVYYVLVGIYGWYLWLKKDKQQQAEIHIHSRTWVQLLPLLIAGLLIFPIAGYLFGKVGNSYSYLDAFTTVFSFIATWLTARKVVECWILWVIVDALLAYQFGIKASYLTGGLYAFYTVISVWCYYQWAKQLHTANVQSNT